MAMDDNESCSSRVHDTSSPVRNRQQRQKLEVYNEVLRRLKDSNNDEAIQSPGFDDELLAHFNRLPARYALDVNVDRAEDVLVHIRLLHLASIPANRPAIEVRLVQVRPTSEGNLAESIHSGSHSEDAAGTSSTNSSRQSIHPPPTFGSSTNLEALSLGEKISDDKDAESSVLANRRSSRPMHEITMSTDDKPKLLSQLTCLLAEMGLNIQEAHAFSTVDGYSLDVFVVDGWPFEETQQLKIALLKEISRIEKQPWPTYQSLSPVCEPDQKGIKSEPVHLAIPSDGTDVWEIDPKLLRFDKLVACGSYGDLYKGMFCNQEVAIKILKSERIVGDAQREFAQEVFIMRKVRHKNVVQFIGACTKPPNMCIVTEFMPGGSVYEYLHKKNGSFKLPALLKVALDVSKGMNYLHQSNIIHRDLKSANLLMGENDIIKVGDFGVARVKTQDGIMTAETGTYRWMAPEVIAHQPYDHKADVFSFGIVLWELLTGKLPYQFLTPLQAAYGVIKSGLRPPIPKGTNPKLAELLDRCWQLDPVLRPEFSEIIEILQQLIKEVGTEGDGRKPAGKFLSVLRRGHH
ncbi:hypothetical protein UlMin_031008 [Ulmus minor]